MVEARPIPTLTPIRARVLSGAAIAVGYVLIGYLILAFGRPAGFAAAIWPVNALALGALILAGRSTSWQELTALGAASALAHWAVGDGFSHSLALGVANGLVLGLTHPLGDRLTVRRFAEHLGQQRSAVDQLRSRVSEEAVEGGVDGLELQRHGELLESRIRTVHMLGAAHVRRATRPVPPVHPRAGLWTRA